MTKTTDDTKMNSFVNYRFSNRDRLVAFVTMNLKNLWTFEA